MPEVMRPPATNVSLINGTGDASLLHTSVRTPLPLPCHFHLSYRTSWETPVLHYSIAGADWNTEPLKRSIVSTGFEWAHATLHLPTKAVGINDNDALGVEFVVTNGSGDWDHAPGGSNYAVKTPGRYRLMNGDLQRVQSPRVLLVTDLDDTLCGDDEATAAFAGWWRAEGAPAGGRLVYNTGRSLELFYRLLDDKRHCMPEPDVLISAVGTKIYAKDSSNCWVEDGTYAASFTNWNLESVREAAYKALLQVGKDRMHFRAPEEMNEHKITVGVQLNALENVLSSIKQDLSMSTSVSYRSIVSGVGEWRFVDLVPHEAGKGRAMRYVAQSLGFDEREVVACGDSGNDQDMLENSPNSIIVGNAHAELKSWAAQTAQNGFEQGLTLVQGTRANGILEGLSLLGFRTT
jgi:sucrose-6F-phosphate phosphohydrolase